MERRSPARFCLIVEGARKQNLWATLKSRIIVDKEIITLGKNFELLFRWALLSAADLNT
jgi:hypothetical protein